MPRWCLTLDAEVFCSRGGFNRIARLYQKVLLYLIAACAAAHTVTVLLMKRSILTERLPGEGITWFANIAVIRSR